MARDLNKALSLAVLAGLALSVGGASWARSGNDTQRATASGRQPVVVELFQSQGCSSCPPANAYLNTLADRPDLLTLSFAVTYWDRLGWKDTFGAREFTVRQQEYARAGTGHVATPEFIVDGQRAVVGNDPLKLGAAIRGAATQPDGPPIMLSAGEVRIPGGSVERSADVWLVRYDPRSRDVPVRAGENGGRTLVHRHIVRQLVRLGSWNGTGFASKIPAAREPGLKTAVLVQMDNGGRIISAVVL